MASALNGISHACFGLSYFVALGCEAFRIWKPIPWLRPVGIFAAVAGLIAHTVYLALRPGTPAEPFVALLLLGWVLAVFSVYGTIHHARQVWAIFVWPLVLILVSLSLSMLNGNQKFGVPAWIVGDRAWGFIHGMLLLFAAVGLAVAGLAAVMFLVQTYRLKSKANPMSRFRLLNLERLEEMNRRAIYLAFPLLTAGLILGGLLLRKHEISTQLYAFKMFGTALLWLVCMVLFYLRYAKSVTYRRFALLSIVAFVLTIIVLMATHPFAISPNAESGKDSPNAIPANGSEK